jgi:hypothetical protein
MEDRVFSAEEGAAETWLDYMKGVLNELVSSRHLPAHVFLNGSVASFLFPYFSSGYFPEFTTSHSDFSVIIGNMKTLGRFCGFTEAGARDVDIVRKAIFINQL